MTTLTKMQLEQMKLLSQMSKSSSLTFKLKKAVAPQSSYSVDGENHTPGSVYQSSNVNGALGSFSATLAPMVNQNGQVNWTYSVADNAMDQLALGATVTLVFAVTIADQGNPVLGSTQTIAVTLRGTNDVPVIGAVCINNTTVVYEDCGQHGNQNNTASGNLITQAGVTDVDTGAVIKMGSVSSDVDSETVATSGNTRVDGTYGYLTINANGQYTYTLYGPSDSGYGALNALALGQPAVEAFNYTVKDEHGAISNVGQLKIDIRGANDEATVTAPALVLSRLTPRAMPPRPSRSAGRSSSPTSI